MTAPPPIHPPELPPERVCREHGIPRLRSGRCAFCRRPPAAPIVPAPSTRRSRWDGYRLRSPGVAGVEP